MDMWQAFKDDINDFVGNRDEEGDDAVEESFGSYNDDEGQQRLLDTSGDSGGVLNNRSAGEDDDDDDDDDDGGNKDESFASADELNESSGGYEANSMFYSMGGDLVKDVLFGNGEDDDDNDGETTPETEAARRCELVETFTEPLLAAEDGGNSGTASKSPSRNVAMTNNSDDDEDGNEGEEDPIDAILLIEEVEEGDESIIDEEATERNEIRQFLKTFVIEAQTQEIAQLLAPITATDATEDYGDEKATQTTTGEATPLQRHYQTFVPEIVSHKDFWTRYFYRCDPGRIAKQWERQLTFEELRQMKLQEDRERAIQEVQDAALTLGKNAASFLKEGILWSAETAEGALTGVEEAFTGVGGAVMEEAASSLKKMHPAKGRPFFVVEVDDDDDDSYYEGESGEYEEEEVDVSGEEGGLGWSAGGGEGDDEEVNFQDVSLANGEDGKMVASKHAPLKLESLDVVKLRQSLMHAEEQRNTMMQMVDERNDEMCKLRSLLELPYQKQKLTREAEWLTHLVAARSELLDINFFNKDATSDSPDGGDTSMNALKSILDGMKNDLCQPSISESTKAAKATIQDLQSKIQGIKNDRRNDPELTKQDHLQTELDQMKVKCNNLQIEAAKENESIARCQQTLQELKLQQRQQAAEHAAQLEHAVLQADAAAPEVLTPISSATSSSMSSGAKVPADGWNEE